MTSVLAQPSFDDLEPPLRDVTFVVVDLETTGGSAAADRITEIGAVKVRSGEVIGEFTTLVNPGRPIPPRIVMLTKITDAMVAGAPSVAAVMPSFLEFARGCALVAHNAPFDIGFLRSAADRLDLIWPNPSVVDTVRLARAVFSRSELPSVRLGVLAAALGTRVTPDHRALHDAQATADVLHCLIDRLGSRGAETLSDLVAAQRRVDPARQRKRHLADDLPRQPGVYLFRGPGNEVLYVGKATNVRSRVRSYFTAAESRARIKEMVLLAERIDHVECASALEAEVREQRLISAHQPRYNRRSKNRDKLYWIRMKPSGPARSRLSVVATPPPATAASVGPFTARGTAQLAVAAAQAMGAEESLLAGRMDQLLSRLHQRMWIESESTLYHAAATSRDALGTLAAAFDTQQQIRALSAIEQLVAALPDGSGGWELNVIRHGRLAGSCRAPRGTDVRRALDTAVLTAETVIPHVDTGLAAAPEETVTLLRYLEHPAVRIARASSGWALPATGAGRWRRFDRLAATARSTGGGQ